jgi:hypothetical protein
MRVAPLHFLEGGTSGREGSIRISLLQFGGAKIMRDLGDRRLVVTLAGALESLAIQADRQLRLALEIRGSRAAERPQELFVLHRSRIRAAAGAQERRGESGKSGAGAHGRTAVAGRRVALLSASLPNSQ